MSRTRLGSYAAGAAALLCAAGIVLSLHAQQSPQGGGFGSAFFSAADANRDGNLGPDELRAAFSGWLAKGDRAKAGYLSQEQLTAIVSEAFPASELASMFSGGAQPQTPKPEDVTKVMASLPAKPMVTPAKPRKVLVLAKARGFVHSCIPLAAKTIEEMGKKTGAWTTTVSYDAAVITAENLAQYDVLLLDNTTGAFLDEPGKPAVHEARKKALLDFVPLGQGPGRASVPPAIPTASRRRHPYRCRASSALRAAAWAA